MELRITPVGTGVNGTADLGADSGTASSLAATPTGTAFDWVESGTGTLTHAQAGTPSVGQHVICRLTRDFDHAANADDLQFVTALILET
jgi:hypothetical protein